MNIKMMQRVTAIVIVIIVIVITVLFIVHARRVKNTQAHGGKLMVEGSYIITIDEKTKKNEFYGKGSSKSFYLNSMESPTIILKRGYYYEFKNETNEPFYFTIDSAGGGTPSLSQNKTNDFIGLADGTIYFKVTDELPSRFYYQSGKHTYMGGRVEISA